jgi:glycosyltransferase involved in cell wall biosynthesis
MRVALIDPSLFTLPYDRALAQGLEGNGHKVRLYARAPGASDNDADGVDLQPCFYRVAGSRAASALPGKLRLLVKGLDHAASMLALRRRLRREQPDVIHFQWLPLPVLDRRLLAGFAKLAPLVLTVHDTDPFNGDPSAALQARGFFGCLQAFQRIIVHTAQGRARLLAQGAPADRLLVMPHGPLVPAQDLPPDPMQGELSFVLFGKIKPYKGTDILIEAFAALPPELRSQARLRVIGKPYMDLAPLHALAESRGIADRFSIEPRFVGDDEMGAIFPPQSVAVFPYREIEASGVLSIALAHGRPVIASALGNFVETLQDGVQGHLVQPGDVAALTAALAHMIADRGFAAACADAAGQLARATPSWAEIGRRTAGIYAEAVSSRAAAVPLRSAAGSGTAPAGIAGSRP